MYTHPSGLFTINYSSAVRGCCRLKFLHTMTQHTDKIVLPIGLGSPGGLKLGSALYFQFRYASPYLWNHLPFSFRQPHFAHSPPGSPHPAQVTSSQSPPLFSPYLSLPQPFTLDLKLIFFKNSFLCSLLIPSGLPSRILTCTELSGYWRSFVLQFRVLD